MGNFNFSVYGAIGLLGVVGAAAIVAAFFILGDIKQKVFGLIAALAGIAFGSTSVGGQLLGSVAAWFGTTAPTPPVISQFVLGVCWTLSIGVPVMVAINMKDAKGWVGMGFAIIGGFLLSSTGLGPFIVSLFPQ